MKLKLITTAIGVFFVIAGSFLYYFFAYKQNSMINFLLLLDLAGWFIVFMTVAWKWVDIKRPKFSENPWRWGAVSCRSFCAYAIFFICAGTNLIFITHFEEKRSIAIFRSQPLLCNIATVLAVEKHHSRSGTYYEAVFQYTAGKKVITNKLSNNNHQFAEGHQYQILYAEDYPEMFRIIRWLK